jgi:hypothetical protein
MSTATHATTTGKAEPRGPSPDRKRFSFGPVWNAAVIAGNVTDHEKLIAQAVKLKVAAKSDARRLKFVTLLAKVQQAIVEGEDAPAEAKAEGKKAKAKSKEAKTEKAEAAAEPETETPAAE